MLSLERPTKQNWLRRIRHTSLPFPTHHSPMLIPTQLTHLRVGWFNNNRHQWSSRWLAGLVNDLFVVSPADEDDDRCEHNGEQQTWYDCVQNTHYLYWRGFGGRIIWKITLGNWSKLLYSKRTHLWGRRGVLKDTTYLRTLPTTFYWLLNLSWHRNIRLARVGITRQTRKVRFKSHCKFYCWIEGWLCNKDTIFWR